jgi:hypothetical protein
MGDVRVECKTTSSKSYALKVSEIQKIQEEAVMGGMEGWAMQIEFQGPAGNHKQVAVLDWYTYLQMKKAAENG